ncbi:amidohydrolase [Pedomonas mirosovicensis]|uniref:amidohydrolase n=1 Tax=Pedomonas mirosovicensis TaxID=2908641 RepID=UPI00216A7CAC|nr:amidohydrolase [Pedomonas mirosovicensis]MCH8685810.1 amidohydrolase [Pedomonas mirosovicensis]
MKHILLTMSALVALGACATTGQTGGGQAAAANKAGASAATADASVVRINKDPYPSTYKPYPSVPTLIRGATILDGKGGQIENGEILMRDGKIVAVGQTVEAPADAVVVDGRGKWVTPGVIDAHSHMGDYPAPEVQAHADGNEVTGPVTSQDWAEHAVWPQDPQFTRALAAGVTTVQVLPGSANLFGGRSVTLKLVPSRTMQGMKFPGAPYGLKMACGENPKRVYGSKGQAPGSRMGNFAVDRQTWAKAQEYKRKWDAYNEKVEKGEKAEAPSRDLQLETLAGVLSGEILVQNHCYRADEMANVIDMSKEFGYKVTAFHHAVEAYKIADLLAKEHICAALWADWWGFKMEGYDGIKENIPMVHAAGACAIVHSDDPNGVQRLNQEAAKALGAGRRAGINISEAEAWQWLSLNPAKALGIADKTGSLENGKMADVVLWNGDPFSAYSRAEKVWVDGALLFDANNPKLRPVSDFELGQPGEGDAK